MKADVFPRTLGQLMIVAAMLLASGRSECQQPEREEPAAAEPLQDECASVVLVQCASAQPETASTAPADARAATKQKLDTRRLRQMQTQAGLNAVEVTGERPSGVESDSWESFRQSVSSAATPDCLDPNAFPAVQGLLRLPFLLHAAAVGKCR